MFDERPGVWMYHCHILDHAEAGMMRHLRVHEPQRDHAPPPLHPDHGSSHSGHLRSAWMRCK